MIIHGAWGFLIQPRHAVCVIDLEFEPNPVRWADENWRLEETPPKKPTEIYFETSSQYFFQKWRHILCYWWHDLTQGNNKKFVNNPETVKEHRDQDQHPNLGEDLFCGTQNLDSLHMGLLFTREARFSSARRWMYNKPSKMVADEADSTLRGTQLSMEVSWNKSPQKLLLHHRIEFCFMSTATYHIIDFIIENQGN